MAGLTPVAWRWSWTTWKLFEQEMKHYMLVSTHIPGNPQPGLPAGCYGLYDGLPIYLMPGAMSQVSVACIGTQAKPAF